MGCAEFIILLGGHRIVTNDFILPLLTPEATAASCCCNCLEGRSIRECNLHFLPVYRESCHFSLYHGSDLLCSFLFTFAIVSETFILAFLFLHLYKYA